MDWKVRGCKHCKLTGKTDKQTINLSTSTLVFLCKWKLLIRIFLSKLLYTTRQDCLYKTAFGCYHCIGLSWSSVCRHRNNVNLCVLFLSMESSLFICFFKQNNSLRKSLSEKLYIIFVFNHMPPCRRMYISQVR